MSSSILSRNIVKQLSLLTWWYRSRESLSVFESARRIGPIFDTIGISKPRPRPRAIARGSKTTIIDPRAKFSSTTCVEVRFRHDNESCCFLHEQVWILFAPVPCLIQYQGRRKTCSEPEVILICVFSMYAVPAQIGEQSAIFAACLIPSTFHIHI